MAVLQQKLKSFDWNIFLRLWDKQKMTPTVARHLLKLQFDDEDRLRMRELSAKNSEGEITSKELKELDEYVRAGTMLSILQSKAQRFMTGIITLPGTAQLLSGRPVSGV